MSTDLNITTETIRHVLDSLYPIHQRRDYQGPDHLLGTLIRTILNQQTTADVARRVFGELIDEFGADWQRIADAQLDMLIEIMRPAGLANQKASRIRRLLRQLLDSTGGFELDFLRDQPPQQARRFLEELPGVGPKTARFTLMFAAGMPLFPIDTNISRVIRRLGWVPEDCSSAKAHQLMESAIPGGEHFSAHMVLIRHGRRICTSRNPRCTECPLAPDCPSAI